jgi:L-threonylcarbamoyladenylate synthase
MNTPDETSAIALLKKGGVGILPTDTLYGIVGSALQKDTVDKIYKLRKRDEGKPMIILLADIDALKNFEIKLSPEEQRVLEKIWPNKISVILPCASEKFLYLHRGTNSLAFRIPQKESLRAFLKETGPLVAPSANTQGEKPAETIAEAKQYFGDMLDFYLDEGPMWSEPSTIIALNDGVVSIIRKGAVDLQTINL